MKILLGYVTLQKLISHIQVMCENICHGGRTSDTMDLVERLGHFIVFKKNQKIIGHFINGYKV